MTLEAFLVGRWQPAGPVEAEAEAAAEAELGCASAAAGLAKWPVGTQQFDCG